jgi:hypothetical protein
MEGTADNIRSPDLAAVVQARDRSDRAVKAAVNELISAVLRCGIERLPATVRAARVKLELEAKRAEVLEVRTEVKS